jgi:hypothetical protein
MLGAADLDGASAAVRGSLGGGRGDREYDAHQGEDEQCGLQRHGLISADRTVVLSDT